MKGKKLVKYLPLALILVLMIAAYISGITNFLTLETLRDYDKTLQKFVQEHAILAPLLFMVAYALSAALSLPVSIYFTLLAGFLFPQPYSTLYAVFSATLGATLFYYAAKTPLQEVFRKRAGDALHKLEKGLKEHTASYFLFLRIIPLFPFWFLNLAGAFFHVPAWTFIWTTFIGILPASFIYTETGGSLEAILESDKPITLSLIFNTKMIVAMVGLGILALLPIAIKKLKKKR